MPSFKSRDPLGWGGDPRRGAALGRPTIDEPTEETFLRPLTLRRIRLDSGGYDPNGTYFGQGAPLWWVASDDGAIDRMLRSASRETAKQEVRKLYPQARFFR